jgi:guanosine-3',5'-bis(diphosphate) 3'-pyrophosphohydrolase
MPDPNDVVFKAAAFAARAHRHQTRKDGVTPYFSHPVRVCLVVAHVFGFDDPRMLAAALLHDTIEDTTTDCDDLIKHFDAEVARWVSALSKDKRRPESEREAVYCDQLKAADWQVKVLKLADLYDNISDSITGDKDQPRTTAEKARRYLAAVRDGLPPEGEKALKLVEEKLAALEKTL